MIDQINVECLIYDSKKEVYSVLVRCNHGSKRTSEIEIAYSDLNNPKGLETLFSDKMGPEYDGDLDQLVKALRSGIQNAPEHIRASRFGLQDDNRTLVSPSRVYKNGESIKGYIKPNFLGETHGRLGKTSEWRNISRYMLLSSSLTFAICLAFAAPIMRLKPKLLSRSFAIVGKTRGGKSTVLCAAASVAGHKPDVELPTFNFSEAGSTELFESYSGLLLPLDDLEAQGGNAKSKHESVHRFAFLYSDGRSKRNSKRAVEAGNTSNAAWRGFALVPAEFGPGELAKRAGEIRQPGAAQRFIEIFVGEHVFDLDPREQVDVDSHCTAILKIIQNNYGHPLNSFLRKFSADGKASRKALSRYMAGLREELIDEVRAETFKSAADYFSLIGAAGMLASDYRIVDVDHSHIKSVVKKLFLRAAKSLDSERYEVRRGLKKLRGFIKRAPRISKGDTVTTECKGFVRDINGISMLVIAREHYNDVFDDRVQGRLVAKHESLSGKISKRAPIPLPSSLDWAAEQIKWPFKTGEKRRWSICIAIKN